MIVGTPAYMSPEQARGKPLDQRVDVWSFGCVLYELLTGRQAFPGETMSDAIAAVLDREPDWTQLPSATPPAVTSLLRRCLEKDLAGRLPDMRSVLAGVDEVFLGHAGRVPTRGTASPRVRGSRRVWLFAALCGVALLAVVVGWTLNTGRGVPGGPDAAVAPIRSVAVVPLENLSGDPGQAYFVDGMSDALTTELGKIGAFERVISWQSMKRYKSTTKSAGESPPKWTWMRSSKASSFARASACESRPGWSGSGPRGSSGPTRTTAKFARFSHCTARSRGRSQAR
jgi:hypothetical protein